PASGGPSRRLLGGVHEAAPEHNELCLWGLEGEFPDPVTPYMRTDSVGVLEHGVALGVRTWNSLMEEMQWSPGQVDRIICHQVGSGHTEQILTQLSIPADRDFTTFRHLGNIGTVSLPITAALAEEQGHLEAGQRVAFLGIGSGLNCLMLGLEW
ncbi:MAG: 3-oxoacyl-[acyl-carrier-protein] synthase III C-terminal domain-containing protein, partial [Planctomycetota bacterium]